MQKALEHELKSEDCSFTYPTHAFNSFFTEFIDTTLVCFLFYFSLFRGFIHFSILQAQYEKLGGRTVASKHESEKEKEIEDFEMTSLAEFAVLHARHQVKFKILFLVFNDYFNPLIKNEMKIKEASCGVIANLIAANEKELTADMNEVLI